jgi:hypothetical protein
MKLRQCEIDRASNGLTIVVRPQQGKTLVALVKVEDGTIVVTEDVVNGETGAAIKSLLRWRNKMGFSCPMAEASRDRFYRGSKNDPKLHRS